MKTLKIGNKKIKLQIWVSGKLEQFLCENREKSMICEESWWYLSGMQRNDEVLKNC
jgi:hypothetical protein